MRRVSIGGGPRRSGVFGRDVARLSERRGKAWKHTGFRSPGKTPGSLAAERTMMVAIRPDLGLIGRVLGSAKPQMIPIIPQEIAGPMLLLGK
jgi:hypothetical protein